MTLRDRLQDRLSARDISAQAASIQAGLGRDAVRNVLRGRSLGASMKTLSALAPVLGVTVEWLAGTEGGALTHNTVANAGSYSVSERPTGQALQVRHEVGAGYWVPISERLHEPASGSLVLADPDFGAFNQWLERCVGDSGSEEYPNGSLVHVVDPAAIGNTPRQGDHCILEATSMGRNAERTIREAVMTEGGLVFRLRSGAARWVDAEPVTLGQDGTGVETRLVGLILGSYRPRK
jgi:transcriptional regulator with XRE-family HTH domain